MLSSALLVLAAVETSARLDAICHNSGSIARCYELPECFRVGNGLREPGEQCDDNNLLNCDGCNTLGRIETAIYDQDPTNLAGRNYFPGATASCLCGNGQVDIGEACDPLLDTSGDCTADCQVNTGDGIRGDGIRQSGENCDDGNDFRSDLCDSLANNVQPRQANLLTSGQEECDDGRRNTPGFLNTECSGNRWTFPQPTFIQDGGLAAPYPRPFTANFVTPAGVTNDLVNEFPSSRYCRPVANDGDLNRNRMLGRHYNFQAPFAGDMPPVPESANTVLLNQANLETGEAFENGAPAADWRFQVFLDGTRVVTDAGEVLSTNTFLDDAPPLGGVGQFRLCPWPSVNRDPLDTTAGTALPSIDSDLAICGDAGAATGPTGPGGCPGNVNGLSYDNGDFPAFDADENGIVNIPSQYFGYRPSVEPRDNFRDNVNQYDQTARNRDTLPRTNRWIGDEQFTHAEQAAPLGQCALFTCGMSQIASTFPNSGAAFTAIIQQGTGCTVAGGLCEGIQRWGQPGKFIKDPQVDLTSDNLYDRIGSQFAADGTPAIAASSRNNMPYRMCMRLASPATTGGFQWRDTGFNVVVTRYCSVSAQNCNSFQITRTSTDGGSENLFLDDNRSFCMRLDTAGVGDQGYCVDPRKVAIDPSGHFYYNPVVEVVSSAAVDRSPIVRDMTPTIERDLITGNLEGNTRDQRTNRKEELPDSLKDLIPTEQPALCSGSDSECPSGERCCTRSLYADQFGGLDAAGRAGIMYDELEWIMELSRFDQGICYDPTTQGCCENGYAFDRYKEHCCKVGGILPVDQPCPCSLPEHCQVPENSGDTDANQHMTCCMQQFPAQATDGATCSAFLNYPHSWRTVDSLTLGYTERRWTQTDASHHWISDYYSDIVGSPETPVTSDVDATGAATPPLGSDPATPGLFARYNGGPDISYPEAGAYLYRGVDAAAIFPRTGLERQRFGAGTQSLGLRTPYAEGARGYPEGVDFVPTKYPVRPNSKAEDFDAADLFRGFTGAAALPNFAENTFPQYINTADGAAKLVADGGSAGFFDAGPDVDLPIQGIGAGHIPQIRDGFCPGRCIDTRVQICCNGNTCNQGYETCCNTTCCNKFSESCKETTIHLSPPSQANPGSNPLFPLYSLWTRLPEFADYSDYDVKFEVCVGTGETVTPLVALQVYVFPTALLLMTLLALLFVGFFVVRAGSHTDIPLDLTGKLIVAFSVAYLAFAVLFFFSAVWQYGIVLVLGGLFTILAGGASRNRPRPAILAALVVQLVLVNFLLDPFNGNEFLSMSPQNDRPGGVFAHTSYLWTSAQCGFKGCQCVEAYNGYFQYAWQHATHQYLDATSGSSILPFWLGWANGAESEQYRRPATGSGQFQDVRQTSYEAVQTFGYCARDWIGTLLYLGGIATLFVLLTTVLLIVAMVQSVKRDKLRSEENDVDISKDDIVRQAELVQ